jgi:hypothetical protein
VAYQTAVGCKSYLYAAIQAARGTPIRAGAIFDRHEIIEMSVEPVIASITDPSLHSGISDRAIYSGGVSWKGSLKVRANYAGLGQSKLLGAVLGSYTGADPNSIVEAADSATSYWTLLYSRGLVENTPLFEELSDVRFTGFTFSCEAGTGAGAMGTYEFEFIGGTFASGVAVPTAPLPDVPAAVPVLFHQAVIASWCNGITAAATPIVIRPKSVKISYKVPMDPNNFYMTTQSPDAPMRTGTNSCEWEFTEVLANITNITAAKTGAVNAQPLVVKFLTNTTQYVQFTSTAARITKYTGPINSYGSLIETIGWKSYYHATDGGCLKILTEQT